jgi:hypothetical protein
MRPGTLDFLAPSINYSSCRDVVQLYSVRLSGDMARIRDTAPAICRGFVIFEARHAKRPQRRAPRTPRSPLRPPCPHAVRRSKNPARPARAHISHNLTPNCVTITEPASDRKEQKFSVPRIARQDSRFGCRQIPGKPFSKMYKSRMQNVPLNRLRSASWKAAQKCTGPARPSRCL